MKYETKFEAKDLSPIGGYRNYSNRMAENIMTEEYNSEINKKVRKNLTKLEIYNLTTIGAFSAIAGTLIAKLI